MATIEIEKFKGIVPLLLKQRDIWTHYDQSADVLYVHFKKPNDADDAELMDADTLLRYDEKGDVIGITFLHASKFDDK